MSKSRRKNRKTDRTSVRVSGREMPVIDRMTIGRRTYLILERMGGGDRERLMAFDPYAGPDGDLRGILVLPRSPATQQQLRVFKRSAAGDNLPKILEFHREGHRLLVVLEWVHGPDLESYLCDVRDDRVARPSPLISIRLVRGLAHGVSHLHRRQQIVHGDIKPANLIVARGGNRLVMIDFGSAWLARETSHKHEGDGVSAAYAAPELQNENGNRGPDGRSDQFSTSVVLYELLTLQLPYDELGGKAGRPEYAESMRNKLIPPSRLSPDRTRLPRQAWQGIDRVVTTGLSLDPDDRYSTRQWLAEMDQVFADMQPNSRLSPNNAWWTNLVARIAERFGKKK